MAKVVRKNNESTEQMISKFKRQVNKEGILKDLRKHEYYLSPSQKRRLKHEEAVKRLNRNKKGN